MRARPAWGWVGLAVVALALAGCGNAGPGAARGAGGRPPGATPPAATVRASASASPAVSSGIRGTVSAGPTCPVERVGSPCPPAPVVGRVEARTGSATVVASAQTSATGTYSLSVAPGSYTLVVVVPGTFPRCPDTAAVVAPGALTTVNIVCDTGIR
ncbi:MAG TPA: hypothetical protein VFW71_08840 [Actinomycetota bacterium]|nr:hypothetical protein [Actinomycetota bacterium]